MTQTPSSVDWQWLDDLFNNSGVYGDDGKYYPKHRKLKNAILSHIQQAEVAAELRLLEALLVLHNNQDALGSMSHNLKELIAERKSSLTTPKQPKENSDDQST